MRTFLQWFSDTFVEDEPMDFDLERSWESYQTLAFLMMEDQIGEWGGRASSDAIRSYLFVCWMDDVDYFTAVTRLEFKMEKV